MDSGTSGADSSPRPALMESFLPCSALTLAHELERKFLCFCLKFIQFKSDFIYHAMSAVWIPLIWEKLWCIWPNVSVRCFLLRQVNQLLWPELDVILKSDGNSSFFKCCPFEQTASFLIFFFSQEDLESRKCIHQCGGGFFGFVLWIVVGLGFVQIFWSYFIRGPAGGHFLGVVFQKGACSAVPCRQPKLVVGDSSILLQK